MANSQDELLGQAGIGDVVDGTDDLLGVPGGSHFTSVILDFGLWARIERDQMRSAARDLGVGVGVELHYLDVPPDELWQRVEARKAEPPWDSHPIRRADLDAWLHVFQAPDAAEMELFDPPPTSPGQSPEAEDGRTA